jgi:hypothetical protein
MEEDEGDDGYDDIGEDGENVPSFIEGARVNSDLYEAYSAHGWSAHPMGTSLSRRSHANFSAAFAAPSEPPEANGSSLPPLESRTHNGSWPFAPSSAFISGNGSTLTRQPSIRRAVRSRTVDFNDFSTRRRSTFRNIAAGSDDPRASDDIPNALNPWMSGPISDEPHGSPAARRFFPFSRRRSEMTISSMPPWLDSGPSNSRPMSPPETNPYLPWRSNSRPPPLIPVNSLAEHEHSLSDESERPQLPRLRGLRAPESVLSRHASPVNGETVESQSSIVISISPEAPSITTPSAGTVEVVAPTMTPELVEQN